MFDSHAIRLKTLSVLKLFFSLTAVPVSLLLFASYVVAQDKIDVPFDISNTPTMEQVETLLDWAGAFEGLSDEEKQRLLEYKHKEYAFIHLYSSMRTYQSCQVEIGDHCATSEKTEVNQCLYEHRDSLSVCCAANMRNLLGVNGLPEAMNYAGIDIPAKSELYFNDNCGLGAIDMSGPGLIGELSVGPGEIQFDGRGGIVSAVVTDGQQYKNIPIKNESVYGTQFYSTGVPKEVKVAADSEYLGMSLTSGSAVSFFENGQPSKLMTNKPFTDKFGRVLKGSVSFYESGVVKSAALGAPWKTPLFDLPENTSVFFNENGEFESVYIYHDENRTVYPNVFGKFDSYPNGQIKRLRLSNMVAVINGVVYPDNTVIELAEDGTVIRDNYRDGTMEPAHHIVQNRPNYTMEEIKQPLQLGVWTFAAGSIVIRDEAGVVQEIAPAKPIQYKQIELGLSQVFFNHNGNSFWGVQLAKPVSYRGLNVPAGADVAFDLAGHLDYVNTFDRVVYNNNSVRPHMPVRFHKNGNIKSVEYDAGAVILGRTLGRTAGVEYFETGELRVLATEEPMPIHGIWFDGDSIYLHKNGQVRSGILNNESRIAGILYAAGTELIFNETGKVIHSWRREPRWPYGVPPGADKPTYQSLYTSVSMRMGRGQRTMLYGPFSQEQCLEQFGPDYNKVKAAHGFSAGMGQSNTPAALGCGTTDEQAGILERG